MLAAYALIPIFRAGATQGCCPNAVAKRIFDRGETPFLHAFESNIAAVGLYEKLGFAVRARVVVTMFNRL